MGFGRDLGAAVTFGLAATTKHKQAEVKHETRRKQHQRRLTSYNDIQAQVQSSVEAMDARFTATKEVLLSTGALTSDVNNNVIYGWYKPQEETESVENNPDYARSSIGAIPAFGLGIGHTRRHLDPGGHLRHRCYWDRYWGPIGSGRWRSHRCMDRSSSYSPVFPI